MSDLTFLVAVAVVVAVLGWAYLPVAPFIVGGIYLIGKLVLDGPD